METDNTHNISLPVTNNMHVRDRVVDLNKHLESVIVAADVPMLVENFQDEYGLNEDGVWRVVWFLVLRIRWLLKWDSLVVVCILVTPCVYFNMNYVYFVWKL